MQIVGQCHCGNIAFELSWPDEAPVVPRACGCTFCTKHGAAWTAHPDAALKVRIRDSARLSRYRFGTETADFHVCAVCGVVPLCTSEIEGHDYAVVNVRTFEGEGNLSDAVPVDFDGEETDARLSRRAQRWISKVEFFLA